MGGMQIEFVARGGACDRAGRLPAPLAALVIAGLSGALWVGLWQVAAALF
jgi:hypothetical protein